MFGGGDSKTDHKRAENPRRYLRWSVPSRLLYSPLRTLFTQENSHSISSFLLEASRSNPLPPRGAVIAALPPALAIRVPVSNPRKSASWVDVFLSKCRFKVKVVGALSNWMQILTDVPQGFVLGPLFFIYSLYRRFKENY